MTELTITQDEKNLRYAHVERNIRHALNRGERDEIVSATSFALGILSIVHPNPFVRTIIVSNQSLLDSAENGDLRRAAQYCLTLLDSLRAEK